MGNKLLALHVIVLFFFSFGHAQNEKIEEPLAKILQKVEQRYDGQFSYADNTVKNISLEMPPEDLTFAQVINYLEKVTGLTFTRLGEKNVTVQKKKKVRSVTLNLDSLQYLRPVVLENYVAKGIEKKQGGVFQVDFQKFGALPGLIEPDVLKSLEALPGVESVDETVSRLNIRGGTNDQNLILWDGIRMFQTGHFFGLISAFNPFQTTKATLIKNGTNPSYGNSVSGVIAMKTDKHINRDFTGEAGMDFLSTQGFVDVPITKKFSVQVSGRTSINKLFKTPTYNKYFDRVFQDTEITSNTNNLFNSNVDFSFYDLSTRGLYQISPKDKLRVNFIHISNDLTFNENEYVNGQVESKQSGLSQHSTGGGAFYKRYWSDRFRSTAQVYISKYKLDSKNANISKNTQMRQTNEVTDIGAKLNSHFRLSRDFVWQNGYEFSGTRVSNFRDSASESSQIDEEENLQSHAFFSNLKYQSQTRKTTIEFGGRANYFQNFDEFRLEPRFSLDHRFLENFTVEVLGEMKSQTTTQAIDFQTDFLGVEKRRWQLADQEGIPILKSKQVSMGLDYQHNHWLISAEGYLKKVTGITSQSQGFRGKFEFAQIVGNYEVSGLDLLLKKKIDAISLWASYSLTNNTYEFPGLERENTPSNIEIVNSLTLAMAYTSSGFKFSAGVKMRDGKPFTALTQEGFFNDQFDYKLTNSDNLKNYLRVDVSASQEFNLFPDVKAYAGISVLNLLDRDNILDSYYEKIGGTIKRIDRKALGLTPNIVFRVKF